MKKPLLYSLYLILACVLPAILWSCSSKTQEQESHYYESLYYSYIQKGHYDSLAHVAGAVFSARDDKKDSFLIYYSGLQCAQAAVFLDNYPMAAAYLDTLSSFDGWDNYPELYAIFNIVSALYEIKDGFDYTSALIHLTEALNYYRSSGDALNTCVTLSNISVIYFFRRDTTGLRYTREGVNISAMHKDNPYMACIADVGMAMMLLLQEDYDNAERYALEAKKLVDAGGYTVFDSRIYMVLAECALSHGNIVGAQELLEKGFRATEGIASDYYFELALTYGKMLIRTGKWAEAEAFLKETLKTVDSNNNIRYRYQFLYLLSCLYEEQGNIMLTHRYFKDYVASRDSIVNMGKEAAFNSLLDKYEKASFDSALRKRQADMNLVIFLCVLSIMTGGFFLHRYIRQKKLNRDLVQLNQEYQKRDEMLRQYLEPKDDGCKKSAEEELFRRLERLMREEHIYRLNDVSLDRLASMLGTNRTYISKIINKFADKSFWGYINMYRIAEATRILSDMNNDIQIKNLYEILGYNSAASFFRVFREETGITPSKYREEVRQIKNRLRDVG